MSFTTKFGNSAIVPAQPQYEAIALSTDIALVWPLESAGGVPYVAAQIDVTPSTGGLSIAMPPGDQGSNGVAAIITNVGGSTFSLTDTSGNLITTIATTVSWIITLIDNSTLNGTWRAYQLASTSSSATAAALAGYGLQANGSLLQINWPTSVVNVSGNIGVGGRSTLYVAETSGITLTLGATATLGVGFITAISNQSDAPINVSTTGGETINGAAPPLVIPAGASGFFVAAAGNFNTIGTLILPLPVALGGTGASTPDAALENLGGTTIGIDIFTAANAAAIIGLLGLTNSPWTESTKAASFNADAGFFYVCTGGAIVATLPLTTTLQLYGVIGIYAVGGPVTVTPQPLDAIGGQAAGAVTYVGQGGWAFFITDANGNWFPLVGAEGFRDPQAAATINLTITDQIVRIDTSVAPTTVNMLNLQTGPVTIKDKNGNAATNNITIVPPNTGTIDGQLTAVISQAYAALKIAGPLSVYSVL